MTWTVPGLRPGAVAIVTGAAGGIGLAIVRSLAAAGVRLACWDRADANLERAVAECGLAGAEGLAVPVDVTNREDCRTAARLSESLGPVRYAVNCAGIDRLRATVDMTDPEWREVLDVNLSGVLYCCLAEYDLMRSRGGAIVNIASMSASVFNRGALPHVGYNASKAGVVQLSRCLAVEWAGDGIRVNSVSPGYTRTAMTDRNPTELNLALVANVPLARMAEVDEIAAPVSFLLSDAAAYITGHDLLIDGGLTAW
ncbi:MAG: SDR family oxidoreductase [Bifidobacteriaceae bacterium]|jgi:NAD(P)-dependent dehydrogenase (short-subunit alcohol dehydrogenase family)|nr:SDR family oxidoreductase [Bifidobacteriaceae bacterium]